MLEYSALNDGAVLQLSLSSAGAVTMCIHNYGTVWWVYHKHCTKSSGCFEDGEDNQHGFQEQCHLGGNSGNKKNFKRQWEGRRKANVYKKHVTTIFWEGKDKSSIALN